MNEIKLNKSALSLIGLFPGLGIMIAGLVGAGVFYYVKALDNNLSVTGSAKQKIVSDSVRWQSSISRTGSKDEMKTGYQLMNTDLEAVKKFLAVAQIKPEQIVISPIFMEQPYNYNNNQPSGTYILRQNITVSSSEVQKITDLANKTQSLIDQGVVFSPQAPEYYYSKLSDLRVDLLSQAVQDAKARAEKIAESSGQKVGPVKTASVGVVQVLPPNSVEVADYGAYDTSSIEKEVMVTVKATFGLK